MERRESAHRKRIARIQWPASNSLRARRFACRGQFDCKRHCDKDFAGQLNRIKALVAKLAQSIVDDMGFEFGEAGLRKGLHWSCSEHSGTAAGCADRADSGTEP